MGDQLNVTVFSRKSPAIPKAINNDRSKVIICIRSHRKAFSWFKIVSKTIFIISLFLFQKYKKTPQVTEKNNIDVPCKRKPLQGTLALAWVSWSRNV